MRKQSIPGHLSPPTWPGYEARLREEVYHIIIFMSTAYWFTLTHTAVYCTENWHCLPSEGYGKAGNGNGNKRRTNPWCSVFFLIDSRVVCLYST